MRIKKSTRKASRFSRSSFAELFFPERPPQLWPKARHIAKKALKAPRLGPASALNAAYVRWLRKESMLENAKKQALQYTGKSIMWQRPYAKPKPRAAINLASVWYTAYPASMITGKHQSILESLGDKNLWKAFQHIGIQGLHTGPMKLAGGVDGWEQTPTIDGHFDRVSNKLDPIFGTEDEFRHIAEIAAPYGGIVIDDIVPGHTGKGADFRLALMNYETYPGIYHMVEIHAKDWHLLPDVPKGRESINLDLDTEAALKKAGYIIGHIYRVMFFEPGVKETNWSVTKPVTGVDGVKRRWVYLHYFKEGQPSLNWLDPSFAGMQLVIGDALHSLGQLGSRGLRLDANGFLGIEKSGEDSPAWSEGHPLSAAANHLIASMVRKVGGFTFQELSLSIEELKAIAEDGADLSYDFITRPAYHHALITGRVEFLQLMQRAGQSVGVDPVSLIHGLDNHDDLTYELVHFWNLHKDDIYSYRGKKITGGELRKAIRREMREGITGEHAPYNLVFTENGLACTTATVIAAVLGYTDISDLDKNDIEKIKEVHILLAMFNALQPGVFALSGWDLTGALTIDAETVKDLIKDGDTRWISRGAYDLMGVDPDATHSLSGMSRARCIYGSLPDQLKDKQSFASRLQHLLSVREVQKLATARQLEIPDTNHQSVLAMIHQLPNDHIQMTVLNFSAEPAECQVTSKLLPSQTTAKDMLTQQVVGTVNTRHTLNLSLKPYQGMSIQYSTKSASKP